MELFSLNTVVPSDVDPCLIQLSSISHFDRIFRICTSSCGYILNIIILVMSYYLIVTWSSRDQKINWTKIFLTEINQRVRLNSSHTKMQKCYETSLSDSIKEQFTTDFFTLLLHSKWFHNSTAPLIKAKQILMHHQYNRHKWNAQYSNSSIGQLSMQDLEKLC